jgi:MoaA/NifB/PqqE/SkfB family radical SAM enzyme
MDLSEFELMFARNGSDLVWLALSGGEITLYDEFSELIELAHRYCKNLKLVTFTTNGLLPEKALGFAKIVQSLGFDIFVTVSLDGDAESHDQIRGVPGNHESAWCTYKLLKNQGITTHFGITLSAANVGFVESTYADLKSEIKAVTIQHEFGIYARANPINDVAIAKALDVINSTYQIASLGEIIEKWYIGLAREFVQNGRSENVIRCAVGRASLHIRPDGATHACMFTPPLGNARRGAKLTDLVNSKQGSQLLSRIDRGDCSHCWMNCYAPHSILLHPVDAFFKWLRVGPVSHLVHHRKKRHSSPSQAVGHYSRQLCQKTGSNAQRPLQRNLPNVHLEHHDKQRIASSR